MRNRKLNEMVRRNVTLTGFTADALGKMSDFTGLSQSEILETALNLPIMRRLQSFTNPGLCSNPIAELLYKYQIDVGEMNPKIGETILYFVKQWIVEEAEPITNCTNFSEINAYIAGHIKEESMKADPYFKTVFDLASKDSFLFKGMEPQEVKDRTVKFIDAMLNGPMDKHRLGEPYLFCILSALILNGFSLPSEEETHIIYMKLSDGYVFPRRNFMF